MSDLKMKVVAPLEKTVGIDNFFSCLSSLSQPFSPELLDFVEEFSSALLTNPSYKKHPELIALGFWLRKSNVISLKNKSLNADVIRLPRGIVFHVAPSNVDTIFIYSLIISLLMGNKNVVRVSSRASEQKDIIIQLLNKILSLPRLNRVSSNLLVVTYQHDDKTSRFLSEKADVRMLWGGDQTVEYFSALPTRATSVDIKFANKYSMAILNAEEINALSDDALNQQTKYFVNDSYSFGQMACSSPRSVCWVGNLESLAKAKNRFWSSVKSHLLSFNHDLTDANYIDKLAYVFYHAAEVQSKLNLMSVDSVLTVVDVDVSKIIDTDMHCGSGLFLQTEITSLADLSCYLTRKVQTLTYLGFDKDQIAAWLASGVHGVDRIVPLGKGLDFDYVWDGVNLFDSVSRIVSIK